MSEFTIAATPTNAGISGTGRTPVNRVMVNNVAVDVRARSMQMQSSPNQHDAVSLTLTSPTLTDTEGLINQPISFVYGISPRTAYWHGYVVQVTEEQRDNVNLSFTLSLLGTTLIMQWGRPRFWLNKSIPSVVHDLVNANMLGYCGSGHPYLWKALAQTSETDWQLVARLIQRIGFALFNWNGVVICEDPAVLYNSNGTYVDLVPDSDLDPMGRQLLEFTPVQAAERTHTGTGVKLAYLTSDGKVGWAEQPDFDNHRFVTTMPIRSREEAEVYIAAANRQHDGWRQVAEARIKGDATIYPGVNVGITTTARNTKDQKFDGKWLVLTVNHSMDNQTFQTDLGLARPDSSPPMQVLPYRPFWERQGREKPSLFTINEGEAQWVSTWADPRLKDIV